MLPSKPFEPDGMELQNFRDVIGGEEGVLVAEADERSMLRALDQLHLGFEDNGTVPSVPTSARATLNPCSGSNSSRL